MGTLEFQFPKVSAVGDSNRFQASLGFRVPNITGMRYCHSQGLGSFLWAHAGGRSNKPPLKPPKRIKKPSKPSKSESDGNASDDDEDQDEDEDGTGTPGTPGTPGTRGPMKPKPSTDSKATPQDTPSVFKEGSKEDLKATYWQKKAKHAKPEKFQKDSDKEPDDKALESKSAKGEKRPNEDKDDLLQEMAMRGKKSKTAPGVGILGLAGSLATEYHGDM